MKEKFKKVYIGDPVEEGEKGDVKLAGSYCHFVLTITATTVTQKTSTLLLEDMKQYHFDGLAELCDHKEQKDTA